MNLASENLVQATHLARRAYLYVRQSTLRQVADNTESTHRQYGLRERAIALGWSAEQIEVIDCDQGMSGASAADRKGFQHLVTEVNRGRAGIVLGLEVSRLSRRCSDWNHLVELCALRGTLMLDQDGLYNPTDPNDQLVLGIKGFMSAVELSVLRARLRGGLLAKASRGELRLVLPVGLVYDEQGQVCLHPDEQVRQSIDLLFATFRRTGTAGATVKHFNDQSLLFPRRAAPGHTTLVLWRPLELAMVIAVLHNPRYAGAFVYGRHRTEVGRDGRSRSVKTPCEQWHCLIKDAHPGYIDWEQFERNEQQLRRSAQAYGIDNRRAPPREGPALLQGLVLCGVCGTRMTVRYHTRGEALVPDYMCISEHVSRRRPVCQIVPGASIDRALAQRLVNAMTPMAIELTLAVRMELQLRLDEADRLRMQHVERIRYEATLAQRRYMRVDPDNRLVAATLEAEWNDKLRALTQATVDAERQRAANLATLDEATEARIRALAQDFPAVWNDPATSNRDRKRMARLLIEDVTLLKTDRLYVHVRFRGGAIETLELPLPKNAWHGRLTPPDIVARVDELIKHYDEAEVVERLNAEGLRTGAGRVFDQAAVRWIRYSHGLKTPVQRLREAGKLTVNQMATLLGQRDRTVRAWAAQGRLRATRCGQRPIWLFEPLDEQPEEIRELAAGSVVRPGSSSRNRDTASKQLCARIDQLVLEGHHDAGIAEQLNTERFTRPNGRPFHEHAVRRLRTMSGLPTLWQRMRNEGKLTSVEIAVRLGIGLKTVGNWVRAGRLCGRRCGTGTRARWVYDPINQQPEPIRQRARRHATLDARSGTLSDAAAGQGAV